MKGCFCWPAGCDGGWAAALRLTAHVRTLLPSTPFSRWQYRCLANAADDLIFITEMERDNVARLTSGRASGTVIYNIVRADLKVAPLPALADDPRFKIGSVSNYAWLRGNDRLVDVAAALAARGRRDLLFVVAGRTELTGNLPGALGDIARSSGTLADYARLARRGRHVSVSGPCSGPGAGPGRLQHPGAPVAKLRSVGAGSARGNGGGAAGLGDGIFRQICRERPHGASVSRVQRRGDGVSDSGLGRQS